MAGPQRRARADRLPRRTLAVGTSGGGGANMVAPRWDGPERPRTARWAPVHPVALASRNNIEVSAARQTIEPKMLIERAHPAQTAGLGDSDKRCVR